MMKFTSTWACQCGERMIFGLLWKISSEVGAPSTVLVPGNQMDCSRSLLSAKSTFPFSGNERFPSLTLCRLAANANEQILWEEYMDRIQPRWRGALGLAFGVSLLSITQAWAAEVTVWCWDPNFNGATMKEAGERYKAAHPNFTLNVVDFAKADLEQKLQAQLSSGTTD